MDMVAYLAEIRFAAESVLSALWDDQRAAKALEAQVDLLRKNVQREYERAGAMKEDEDLDTYLMGVATHWDTYFGPDKELYHQDKALNNLLQRLAARRFSIDSLAAAVLQHAKQGISIVHGKPGAAPTGRAIASQNLRTVIWQGRNQALHWEDHHFHKATENCFKALAVDIDPVFADYATRCMAFDVVSQLGWTDFPSFESDMLSLA